MAPGLELDVVAGHHNDQAGVFQAYGRVCGPASVSRWAARPLCVAVVNVLVAGALGAPAAEATRAEVALVAAAGNVVGVTDLTLAVGLSVRHKLRVMAGYQPRFPSPVSTPV